MSALIPRLALLIPRPAETAIDGQLVRRIRNECAPWMTGDNRLIDPVQQARWWRSESRRRNAIWLYATPDGEAVGFGLFRMEDGRWWATLGLLEDWRGQGHGADIYRHLMAHCPGDLWIRVLLTNPGSARAAEKAGFRAVDTNGIYAELVARRDA
jgi:RimJ/RimL family protein N-acetyltransferase